MPSRSSETTDTTVALPAGVGRFDRRGHERRVGAEAAVGGPSGALDRYVRTRHLGGETRRPDGDVMAVRYNDDADHSVGQIYTTEANSTMPNRKFR